MKRLTNYNPESARHALHKYIVSEEAGGEWRAFCPVCEDPGTSTSPSASFNFEKDVWHCQSNCSDQKGAYWRISVLIPFLKSEKGFDYRSERMKGRNADTGTPSPLMTFNVERSANKSDRCTDENVKSWERRLHGAAPFLAQLTDERGLSIETIRKYSIGWDGQRYTIPVYDSTHTLVNVRRYKINTGPKGDKMLNIPGCGEARLFNIESLRKNDTIVLCEGEMDCIILEQYGIPAVTTTAGASTFKNQFGPDFEHKTVYICYDNDDGGRKGALKAGKTIAAYADQVYQIEIPLPHAGADVTDFLVKEGHTAQDFKDLMAEARPMNPTRVVEAEEAPVTGRPVSLNDSWAQEHQSETLEIKATVTGKQNPPFQVPKRFNISCSMNKGPICEQCPVAWRDGNMDVEIASDDTDMFRFVGAPEEKHPKLLQKIADARCTDRANYTVEEKYNMEELIVSNSVDERKVFETDTPVSRSVYSVGTHDTPENSTIKLVGKNVTSPRDGREQFMAWRLEQIKTSLDEFELDRDMRFELDTFRVKDDPDKPPSPLDRCFEIAQHHSTHYTHIYGRDLLHVAYDLVWHSPLAYYVEGRLVEKGWLEMMVVGDTRTGKSETAIQLARLYGAGVVKSCESMSFAGLVGGNQQVGSGSWVTTWGVIPLNDRRLVVLDEVSGLKEKDVIENMSSIRSSGIAQITKINTQSTSARTRLIWITNPADGVMIDERSAGGLDALSTIVANQEDIARFDFVMAARASEVDSKEINKAHRVREKPFWDKEACESLVLWAWSLKPEQINFTPEAVKEARKLAEQIGEEYVPDPPLLQAENARFKLYRIAAAIAARTFAIEWPDKGKMQLRVSEDHIRDAKRFLDMVYGEEAGMHYAERSQRILNARRIAVSNVGAVREYLLQNLDTVFETLISITTNPDGKFRNRDFEEFGGMSRSEAATAVVTLLKFGHIHRLSQGYIRMDKMLNAVVRELKEELGR